MVSPLQPRSNLALLAMTNCCSRCFSASGDLGVSVGTVVAVARKQPHGFETRAREPQHIAARSRSSSSTMKPGNCIKWRADERGARYRLSLLKAVVVCQSDCDKKGQELRIIRTGSLRGANLALGVRQNTSIKPRFMTGPSCRVVFIR
jgi:hypothetical protein